MTLQEFSDQFDILYNNIMSNQAPGLDEYEKSVFLTKAQDEIIKAYFLPQNNKVQAGFDGDEKRQYDFSNLIRTATLLDINKYKERVSLLEKTDRRSKVFLFPKDYFLSVNEIIYDNITMYSVIPLQYREYQRLMLKPYALPMKKGVWRLFTDKKNCNSVNEYPSQIGWNSDGTPIKIGEDSNCNYTFTTSWADQKRNISLKILNSTIVNNLDSEFTADLLRLNQETPIIVSSKNILFLSSNTNGEYGNPVKMKVNTEWSDDSQTYNVSIFVMPYMQEFDDEEVIEAIKAGFRLLKDYIDKGNTASGDIVKAMEHLDGLEVAEVPSKYNNFNYNRDTQIGGYTLKTSVVQLPIAEVVGKFKGDITYQLRYVKKPIPIILRDLRDDSNSTLSIGGEWRATECELASEIHYEILQRAVELAKIAYQGDLSATLNGGLSATDKGNIPVNR